MTKTYLKTPSLWGTFDEKCKETAKLSKQHLSNIYWYHLIFFDIAHEWVKQEISTRFDGKLDPYKPCKRFTMELVMLRSKNMLKYVGEKSGKAIFDIMWKGNKIGIYEN